MSITYTTYDLPITSDVAHEQMGLTGGTVTLLSATATKVYQLALQRTGLYWAELTANTAYSVPLSRGTSIPAQFEGYIRIETINRQDGHAKFLHEVSNQKTEITYNTYQITVNLLADVKRVGKISETHGLNSNRWIWGKHGYGAIVMPNIDRDVKEPNTVPGQSELAPLTVQQLSNAPFPKGYCARLSLTACIAEKVTIYQEVQGTLTYFAGKDAQGGIKKVSDPINWKGEKLYVSAHAFANTVFNGLLSFELNFMDERTSTHKRLASDTVLMRVSPWIMTPHTQDVQTVYVARLSDNQAFLTGLQSALQNLGVPLEIIEPTVHQGDRWVQDEFETGYAEDATHKMPIVFNGPRNRALDAFPETLLGPNFGHFEINGTGVNSLDSFGNLEVSPPITANGQHYPFGRIIYGGPDRRVPLQPTDRQMMMQVRGFLAAQLVQSPIEIYSDWLLVGHVDEFMTFVPDNTSVKGFKLLLASPKLTRDLLLQAQQDGHGHTLLFKGLNHGSSSSGFPAEVTIDALLADTQLERFNQECDQHMAYNQALLEQELQLDTSDIIHIPVMFKEERGRAIAYFPDMVNHLVLGGTSVVPKPYGPVINGKCLFEKAFQDLLPTRRVEFIDDWYSYHQQLGEVHCGTNVVREPMHQDWFRTKPPGAIDI